MGKISSIIKRWLPVGVTERATTGVAARSGAGTTPIEELSNPAIRFEPVDVHARSVLYTGIGVVGGMLLITALVYPVYKLLEADRARHTQTLPSSRGHTQVPPEPRLQQDPRRDLSIFRTRENTRLQTYGWLDREHGVVSIPIERAIQLTLERGIAPRPAPPGNLYFNPHEGSRLTGFQDKVEPAP